MQKWIILNSREFGWPVTRNNLGHLFNPFIEKETGLKEKSFSGEKFKAIYPWMCRYDVINELKSYIEKFEECDHTKASIDNFVKNGEGNLHQNNGLTYWFYRLYKSVDRVLFKKEVETIVKISTIGEFCNRILTPSSAFGSQSKDLEIEETYLTAFLKIAQTINKRRKDEGY